MRLRVEVHELESEAGYRGVLGARPFARVVIEHGEHVGVGELCPLPGTSPDSFEDALSALRAARLPAAPPHGLSDLDRLGVADCGLPPSATFALEVALLDLAARTSGAPLARWLGRPTVPILRPAVVVDPREPLAPQLAGDHDRGRAVKIKVGPDVDGALRSARAVRSLVGDLAELRLDGNGTCTSDEATAIAEGVRALGTHLLEEVVPLPDVPEFAVPGVRLALDESLRGAFGVESSLRRLLEDGCVAALVLKPTTLGLGRTFALASRAHEAGRRAILSHCHEPPRTRRVLDALAFSLHEPSPGLHDGSLGADRLVFPEEA